MCLAITGKILQINGREALIAYPGENRKAFLGDDVKVKLGDYVLVQMGVIIRKLTGWQAKASLQAWTEHSITNKTFGK